MPAIKDRVVQNVQGVLSRFAQVPDRYELQATQVPHTPFKLVDNDPKQYAPSDTRTLIAENLPTLFSSKPSTDREDSSIMSTLLIELLQGKEHDPTESILNEAHLGVDHFLNKNQSEEPTQAIPAFDPEVIGKKARKALEETGLIPKQTPKPTSQAENASPTIVHHHHYYGTPGQAN
ncbi:MAG: hypothetical protein ACK5T0_03045 [Vampirovibrionales bacterium]